MPRILWRHRYPFLTAIFPFPSGAAISQPAQITLEVVMRHDLDVATLPGPPLGWRIHLKGGLTNLTWWERMIIPASETQSGAWKALCSADSLVRGAESLLSTSHVSAYAFAIFSLEEVGKAVLLWKNSKGYTCDVEISRQKKHRGNWFFDHSRKLCAAFWFHRGMITLEQAGVHLNIRTFLETTRREREDSLYVNWDGQAGKWRTPVDWFHGQSKRFGDTVFAESFLGLARHIIDGAKRNLG